MLVWRITVFVLAALPLVWMTAKTALNELGVDPVKELLDFLGHSALVLLLVTLCLSPLQRLRRWRGWLLVRRQLGLWAFSYASLHMLVFVALMIEWDAGRMWDELQRRPYVLIGSLALIGLLMLALTSNRYSMRRLGVHWKSLHRLVYPILILVLLHYLWVVRSDMAFWLLYALAGTVLLLFRLPLVQKRVLFGFQG